MDSVHRSLLQTGIHVDAADRHSAQSADVVVIHVDVRNADNLALEVLHSADGFASAQEDFNTEFARANQVDAILCSDLFVPLEHPAVVVVFVNFLKGVQQAGQTHPIHADIGNQPF